MTSVNVENAKAQLRGQMREIAVTKVLDIRKELQCPECEGSGVYSSPSNYGPCSDCAGSGYNPNLDGSLNDLLPKGTQYVKLSDVLAIIGGGNDIIKGTKQ